MEQKLVHLAICMILKVQSNLSCLSLFCVLCVFWTAGFTAFLGNKSNLVANENLFSCSWPFSFGMKAWYFRVPGLVIDLLNLVFSSFVISVWASVELKRMTVSVISFLAHLNKSCAVKMRFYAEHCKLAFAASLFKFPLIPSLGPFPCAVAWKCDSARIPKSCLWCTILMFFMRESVHLTT